MKTAESAVLRACLDYLRLRGHFVFRVNNGAAKIGKYYVRFTDTLGVADIIGTTKDGMALAVETKQEGKYPTKEQRDFGAEYNKRGGLWIVARSIEDLQKAGL